MEKAFVKKSKYDKNIQEFLSIRDKKPTAKLKEYAIERGIHYGNFSQAVHRKGIRLRNNVHSEEATSYTVLQFGAGKTLFNKIKKKAEAGKISMPELIRKELEECLK